MVLLYLPKNVLFCTLVHAQCCIHFLGWQILFPVEAADSNSDLGLSCAVTVKGRIYYQRSSATKGCLTPQVVFHLRLFSTKGSLPLKVVWFNSIQINLIPSVAQLNSAIQYLTYFSATADVLYRYQYKISLLARVSVSSSVISEQYQWLFHIICNLLWLLFPHPHRHYAKSQELVQLSTTKKTLKELVGLLLRLTK